ncbi:MAG: cell envelope integrity protein CreD [Alphaproteobacteria bacterium]|nr:cell envelope integrity protein CreD [Alphaproteobacteria bacterium]MBU0859187.1 cell envelope integrity protein CreD [Alphaproteobacteria bacterium]
MSFGSRLTNNMTMRFVFIGILVLAMLVPMMMVHNVIEERGQYYHTAVEGVRDGWADAQVLGDPVLVIPYSYTTQGQKVNVHTNQYEVYNIEHTDKLYVFPTQTKMAASFKSENRKRGLFNVPIYAAQIDMSGRIRMPDLAQAIPAERRDSYKVQDPYMILKVADPRGLHGDFKWSVGDKDFMAEPGSKTSSIGGIHTMVPLDAAAMAGKDVPFALNFGLKGTRSFSFIPTARQTDMSMKANWPHPSFGGRFLPVAHDVRDDGFSASWSVGALATNMGEKFMACAESNSCHEFESTNMSVSFIDSTDLYAKMLRSAKYGMLFIGLTFMAFFMFEVLRHFKIHPLQYFMVGGSLVIFYLLLLALAEHIGFGIAYLMAALAVCLLLGYYVSHIAHSRAVGTSFGGGVMVLYGVLYTIMGSEDYALLMGAGLLFTVLAATMILTRRIDWYAISLDREMR